jgi:D-beta-D-heptose 7-phosphate kinase/D-beta-D-heptose 1-phosphate adenosyltransferase
VHAVVVIGDSLLDRTLTGSMDRLTPEQCPVIEETRTEERPGGAALAAAAVAADGAPTTLVTALSPDPGGRRLHELLRRAGVHVVDLGLDGPTPEKVRVRSADRTVVRIDRSCSPVAGAGQGSDDAERAVGQAGAVLVSDYGRGAAASMSARIAVQRAAARVPVVWDPHPRGPDPLREADLITPNLEEARQMLGRAGRIESLEEVTAISRELTSAAGGPAVVVTLAERGAVLAEPGRAPFVVPARPQLGDACGAGDRFAARLTYERACGGRRASAVVAAVQAASAFVSTGRLAVAVPAEPDAVALAAELRRTGRRIIVAGGCFDLLHAGHVAMLEAARSLGDALIVCVNSDRSVRALKGPGRPIVGQDDRRRVLEALSCVDAVHLFDELTPCSALEALRPDLFCKGGDYTDAELPEQAVLSKWGGEVAVLPYVDGRSSSQLIALARVS